MKLRSKLIAYTFAVVLLTVFSTLGGALYLHYIETSQEKHLQLKSASINFQRRIDGFIGNSLQHFHYFCQQTDLPLMVTTEQTLLESGLSVSDSNFIAALYSFAKAFQAHAFALYYVDNSRGQDALRYVYDKTIDGLMRIDNHTKGHLRK